MLQTDTREMLRSLFGELQINDCIKNNCTYLRCIRTRASRESCRRPISWLRLSYSCLRSSMSGSVLVPVGTSSSLSVGIWLILSIGICSGGAGATYRRRGGFRGVAFADRFRAKTLNNVIFALHYHLWRFDLRLITGERKNERK